ncbi:MAG: hypothetical protein PHH08_03025 [Candidatus ainarchaeum sp.]|nr:hypothetical protein [Candidatus ainarchaeum sp.]
MPKLQPKYANRRRYHTEAEAIRAADRLGKHVLGRDVSRSSYLDYLSHLRDRANAPEAKEEFGRRMQEVVLTRNMPSALIKAKAKRVYKSRAYKYLAEGLGLIDYNLGIGDYRAARRIIGRAIGLGGAKPRDYWLLAEETSNIAKQVEKICKDKEEVENFWALALFAAKKSGNRKLVREIRATSEQKGYVIEERKKE